MATITWYNLKDRKPNPYDLITVRDEKGREQNGWWNGHEFEFYKRRVGDVVEWKSTSSHFH